MDRGTLRLAVALANPLHLRLGPSLGRRPEVAIYEGEVGPLDAPVVRWHVRCQRFCNGLKGKQAIVVYLLYGKWSDRPESHDWILLGSLPHPVSKDP